jgi:hypothetical protein
MRAMRQTIIRLALLVWCIACFTCVAAQTPSTAQPLDVAAAARAQQFERNATTSRQQAAALRKSIASWEDGLIKNNRVRAATAPDARTRSAYANLVKTQEAAMEKMRSQIAVLAKSAEYDDAQAAHIRRHEPVEDMTPAQQAGAPASAAPGLSDVDKKELARVDGGEIRLYQHAQSVLSELRSDLQALHQTARGEFSAVTMTIEQGSDGVVEDLDFERHAYENCSNAPPESRSIQAAPAMPDTEAWIDATSRRFEPQQKLLDDDYARWQKDRNELVRRLSGKHSDYERAQVRPGFSRDAAKFNASSLIAMAEAEDLLWQAYLDEAVRGIPIKGKTTKIPMVLAFGQEALFVMRPIYRSLWVDRCRYASTAQTTQALHALMLPRIASCSSVEQQQRDIMATRFRALGDRLKRERAKLIAQKLSWLAYLSSNHFDIGPASYEDVSPTYFEGGINPTFGWPEQFHTYLPLTCSGISASVNETAWGFKPLPAKYPDIETVPFQFTYTLEATRAAAVIEMLAPNATKTRIEPVEIRFVENVAPYNPIDNVEFTDWFRVEVRYTEDPGSDTVSVSLQTTSGGTFETVATRVDGDRLRYRTSPIRVGDPDRDSKR